MKKNFQRRLKKMKQRIAILSMILVLSGVCFGQIDAKNPKLVLVDFWVYALEGDSENVEGVFSRQNADSENYKSLKEAVKLIALNRIKIDEFTQDTIFRESAFFEIKALDKDGKYWDVTVLLISVGNRWKIQYLTLNEKRISPPLKPNVPPDRKVTPIQPFFPKDYPVKKDCPKCT